MLEEQLGARGKGGPALCCCQVLCPWACFCLCWRSSWGRGVKVGCAWALVRTPFLLMLAMLCCLLSPLCLLPAKSAGLHEKATSVQHLLSKVSTSTLQMPEAEWLLQRELRLGPGC